MFIEPYDHLVLEAVHKRRPQSGGRVFVQYGQGRVLQMRTSALFGEKNVEFFEIYGVSARKGGRGIEPLRTFYGQFFAILYGRLLWTAPSDITMMLYVFASSKEFVDP